MARVNRFGYFYSLNDINIEKALESNGYLKCKTSGDRDCKYIVRCTMDKSYKYTSLEPGTARSCMKEAQPDHEMGPMVSDSIAQLGYSEAELAPIYARYAEKVKQDREAYERSFDGQEKPWYADRFYKDLSFSEYLEGIRIGQFEYQPNRIYTNGRQGSLSFYCNGIEYRLDGVSASYPTYHAGEGVWKKAPSMVLSAFESAYAQGQFNSIDYTKMTNATFDTYLSTCT